MIDNSSIDNLNPNSVVDIYQDITTPYKMTTDNSSGFKIGTWVKNYGLFVNIDDKF